MRRAAVWARVLEQAMHFGGYRRLRRFFRLMGMAPFCGFGSVEGGISLL